MKNKALSRLPALLLAAVLTLSLAACGKQEAAPANPDATPTPELVYAANYTTLRENHPNGLWPEAFTEGGVYLSSSDKVGEEIPEGVVPEYKNQYAIYEEHYYFSDYDGNMRPLDGYVPLQAAEDTEGRALFDSSSYLQALIPLESGELLALETVSSSWYEGSEENVQLYSDEYYQHRARSQEVFLRHLAGDGSELSCVPLELDTEEFSLSSGSLLDEDGSLLLPYDDQQGQGGLIAFDTEGKEVYRVEAESWIQDLFRLRDGRIVISCYGQEGMQLLPLDSAAHQWGKAIPLPSDAYDLIPGGGDWDFCYTSGVHLYGYDIEAGSAAPVLDWISCDVSSDSLSNVYIDAEGAVHGIINSGKGDGDDYRVTTELLTLKLTPSSSLPQKVHLTLAAQGLGYDLRTQIVDFNRHSDSCHIDVVDYSEYNTDDDYSAGLTKLTTEILAGNMPDLLVLDNLPYTQLAAKGLLEDLYPWLDQDPELSREDFFDSVLRAQEVNGGLYQVCSDFGIATVLGAESVVGGTPGWTYEQLDAALATMPEGCEIFSTGTTKADILEVELALNLDRLVDWSTGECRFDSEDFLSILRFAGRFVNDYDWDSYDSENDGDRTRLAQGRQMLMNGRLHNFDDMQMDATYFGGGDNLCYIGYPTLDGSIGSAFTFSSALAMSSSCTDKEAAWDFLRVFLTDSYQADSPWDTLPTNRNTFQDKLKEATTPKWKTDGLGNTVLDENGEPIEESRGGVSFGDGAYYDIYAMTQKQADALLYLVEHTTVCLGENARITELVKEETQAFFSGQKSAEEVAKLIQSKVNLYVNEQK